MLGGRYDELQSSLERLSADCEKTRQAMPPFFFDLFFFLGHNYIGADSNCLDHNYIGHAYIGYNYISDDADYIGHTYPGYKYI